MPWNSVIHHAGFEYRDIQCREGRCARVRFTTAQLPLAKASQTGRGVALTCRYIGQGESGAELLLERGR